MTRYWDHVLNKTDVWYLYLTPIFWYNYLYKKIDKPNIQPEIRMLKLEGVLKNDILNISTKFRAKIREIEVRHRHVGTNTIYFD